MSSSTEPPNFFPEKERYFETIEEIVNNRDPGIGLLAAEVYQRVKDRITRMAKETESKNYPFEGQILLPLNVCCWNYTPKTSNTLFNPDFLK